MINIKGINSARILAIIFSLIGIFVASLNINMANSCTGNSIHSEKNIAIVMLVIEILVILGTGASFYFMP